VPARTLRPMRALAYGADDSFAVVERPDPAPGPGQVVVAVERCGICGSDLHLKASRLLPAGAVLGHEFAGAIASTGDGVTGWREGDRVVVLPMARCGTCQPCLRGDDQLCLDQARTALGLGFNDGAFAEYVATDASACFSMPDAMTVEQGALVEPYAVGLHAVRRSRADAGSTVGIIGAGPIGLMTLAALRREGVDHVVVAERSDRRAEVAARLGAEVVLDDANRLSTAFAGPLDVIFECAGTAATPQVALNEVRSGGEVVLVGVAGPMDSISLLGVPWVVKEVDVHPCFAYTTAEFGEAVEAVAAGALHAASLGSDVRPLDAADTAFTELVQPRGPVKVLLAPGT
jgi:(R,R)-butanediol dehydrogenase/meso-butanediol dehydrogenase/diacetyl reductase